ncbi:hypothetical protein ACOBQJ_03255 [Pelotomaculum propionicicum]|uniref:hypothetical protein n=1 Tax=Pelotomaculum propionicicum TaxID=258475 RepID=UPI003B7F3502
MLFKKTIVVILVLVGIIIIAGLIFTKKPVDDYRFLSGIFNKPVIEGELTGNEAMDVGVDGKVIGINIYPNKLDNLEEIEKIVKRYSPSSERSEAIKAVKDSCDAVKSGDFTDGAETYRYTSETGNSIYIRTWSNYGGTVYILIKRSD